jgi:hypothetical protein
LSGLNDLRETAREAAGKNLVELVITEPHEPPAELIHLPSFVVTMVQGAIATCFTMMPLAVFASV